MVYANRPVTGSWSLPLTPDVLFEWQAGGNGGSRRISGRENGPGPIKASEDQDGEKHENGVMGKEGACRIAVNEIKIFTLIHFRGIYGILHLWAGSSAG